MYGHRWTVWVTTLVIVGCSAESRDRFRHWFFEIPENETGASDGVPSRSLRQDSTLPRAWTNSTPVFAAVHPPFAGRACTLCHEIGRHMQPREEIAAVCKSCHADYFRGEVPGHFPTVSGECLACHDPHHTRQPHLVKEPVPDLCLECHDEPEDLSQPVHAVSGVERCTACHDPHFGESPLLKPHPQIPIPVSTKEDEEK